ASPDYTQQSGNGAQFSPSFGSANPGYNAPNQFGGGAPFSLPFSPANPGYNAPNQSGSNMQFSAPASPDYTQQSGNGAQFSPSFANYSSVPSTPEEDIYGPTQPHLPSPGEDALPPAWATPQQEGSAPAWATPQSKKKPSKKFALT